MTVVGTDADARETTELPPGWEWATPEQLASAEPYSLAIGPFGSNLKVEDYRDTGVPLIFVRNIRAGTFGGEGTRFVTEEKAGELCAHHASPGDLLITKMGDPPGDAALYPKSRPPAVITADCIKWTLAPQLEEPSFILYALRSEVARRQIYLITQGVAQQKISLARFKSVALPIPPLAEQSRIVAEIEKQFSRLDAAVAALKRVQANLKRYRASVLQAACEGRLVPTEAELTRGRDNEPAKEADSSGELPTGWRWATLGQLAAIQGGIQKQPKRAPVHNRYRFLRVANVYRSRLDLRDVHEVELFGNELEKLRLETGDLLIVEGNGSASEIGRMAIWSGQIENCVHQNHLIRARLREGALPRYVECYWNSPTGASQVMRVASSTSGLHTLSVSKVASLPIPVPPFKEQERIVAEVDRILSAVDNTETSIVTELKRAERLRQSILKRAFEGKLVPQDPADEPASLLLERIRAERSAAGNGKAARNRRGRKALAAQPVLPEPVL